MGQGDQGKLKIVLKTTYNAFAYVFVLIYTLTYMVITWRAVKCRDVYWTGKGGGIFYGQGLECYSGVQTKGLDWVIEVV